MIKTKVAVMLITGVLLSACGGEKEDIERKLDTQKTQKENTVSSKDLSTPLITQVMLGNRDEVQSLLKQGASPLSVDRYGLPVLFTAAKIGNTEIINLLINAGADVNASIKTSYSNDGAGYGGTKDGTVLGYAAGAGKIEVMELLVNAGADIDGAGGETPLMHATEQGRAEAVEWLLNNGSSAGQDKALEIISRFINPKENYIKTRKLLADESYP